MRAPPLPDEDLRYHRGELSLWLTGLGFLAFTTFGIFCCAAGSWTAAIVFGLMGAGGVAAFVQQQLSPSIFSRLTAAGIAFPFYQVPLVAWASIRDVRVGARTVRYSDGTNYRNRAPLILVLQNDARPGDFVAAGEDFIRLPDGTVELRIETTGCPISTADLIARIRARISWPPSVS